MSIQAESSHPSSYTNTPSPGPGAPKPSPTPQAHVHFERAPSGLASASSLPATAPTSNGAGTQRRNQGPAIELMSRLYDKPENSQALVTVKRQQQQQSANTAHVPRPPSGKSKGPGVAFRTTILRKDYVKRQRQRGPAEDPPLTLNLLQRQRSRDNLRIPVEEPIPDIDVRSEEELLFTPASDETKSVATSATPVPEKKVVTFGDDLQRRSPVESVRNPSPLLEQTTPKQTPKSATPTTALECLPGPDEVTPRSKSARVSSGTSQQDPSAVLTYLKKNIYDDTVPKNDDFLETLLNMRTKLGWVVELPRHGPGCRKKMDKLKDKPELDANIEAAIAAKEDDGQFIYALPKNRHDPRARYNPYDLQVVSAHAARVCSVYYTASASSITRVVVNCEGKEESVRTPALTWLWERRLFLMVHQLPVFVKFRQWKGFQVWQANVQNQKNSGSRVVLHKTLFAANEVLQGCLLHVRSLCEAASGSLDGLGTGDAAISLVSLNKSVTLTLNDLVAVQETQAEHAFEQLTALRGKIVQIVWESCATVAEMEGVTHGIRPDSEKKVQLQGGDQQEKNKQEQNVKYRVKTKYGNIPVYEKKAKTPKKDRPSYAQIAEWRKILHRLSYFLRSVDYLLLELLRRLVVTATRTLLKFVTASQQTGLNMEDEDLMLELNSSLSPHARGELEESQYGSDTDSEMSYRIPRLSGFGSQMTSKSSFSNSRSSTMYLDSKKTGKGKQPYVVPKFDFDKPEEVEKPPDIDEVLEEIEKQNEVIEISESVISLQLVLNVPQRATLPRRGSIVKSRRKSVGKAEDGRKKEEGGEEEGGGGGARDGKRKSISDTKKNVTFTDEAEESASEYEDTDSDYTDTESEHDAQENQTPNRFAYSESDPRHEKKLSRDVFRSTKAFLALSPSEHEVQTSFRGLVVGFENTVGQVVSMLREPKLSPFYLPPRHDLRLNFDEEKKEEEEENVRPWPDTEALFGDDLEYQSLVTELMDCIVNVTDMVLDYSEDFEKYCVMVDRARQVDVEDSMAKKLWSTEEFQHVLAIHTDQVREMRSMPRRKRLGMIQVLSEGYCESCLPYPRHVLKAVCDKLPVIALKRNEDLLKIIKGASKKLDKYPASVEEFVEHLSFLGKMTSEMPALEKEYAVVIKLYTIAKDFNVDIEPEELALYQTLSPSFQHLKTIILYAEAKKEDNIRKFSSDLDTLIHDIRSTITGLKNMVRDPVLLHGDTMASTALDKISFLTEEVTDLSTKARSYANYQERFGSSMSQSKRTVTEEFLLMDKREENSAQEIQTDLSEIERDLTLRRLLWESQEEWDKLAAEWTANPFENLDVENLQKSVNRFTQTVFMLEKGLPGNEVVPRLKEKVMNFKQMMPIITSLRNPSLKARHWQQIQSIIGKSIVRDKSFTLGNLLEMNIARHKEKVQDISTTASNEATLERMLQKVIDLWQSTDFRLVPHSSGAVVIIAGADDILAQLEESQVTIGTIRGSRYVTPIKNVVEEWERKLTMFARTLDEWMTCQRNWLYLEQIFTTPDIQRQLPSESKLFGQVDKSWKEIMRRTEDHPNALKSATAPGALELLQSANSSLEKIQKCLEDYLETKRLVFPRFYFLSNDELLDILAQSKDPDAVQPHLGKCFGNIKSLEIKQLPRQPPTVKTISSAEGEVIGMPKNVRARGPVEQWLGSVETGMFDTVKKHLKLGLQDWLGIEHDEWVLKHPGQVVLTVAQIMFNKHVMTCFLDRDPITQLQQLRDKMVETLNILARLVTSNLVPHKRLSINALLTIDVHNRDIINSMVDNRIGRRDDFEWTRQLRYEWDEQTNNCNVLQSNATFTYGYEYLGCSPRLVITPLTDRCYLTLTGALHLHLGGSPAGPAGTGKTETVKDLAKAMGKQCVVFNCSEGLDYKMLGKFFSGLAQSGSWCCFDEFNRLDVEVLSVVAQQIHTIKTAKDQMVPRFVFEGKDIRLNMTCGLFITMNPSYAGRVELPDNLKSFFRPVAMMVPDYALIAEIMLFSEGFTAARSLSTKIVNLYQLASKQLSQQDHYDFGMRAIKSVLVMAGQKKRQAHSTGPGEVLDEEDEAHILIHSLQDANLPKFLAEDVPLFESIMADLFPGVSPPQVDQGALEKAISMSIRDQGLQHWPNQTEKVKQLHSQILVRHGVMLVGPTGGGKTTVRSILQRALVLLPMMASASVLEEDAGGAKMDKRRQNVFIQNRAKKGHVETFTINPKCVKLGELYGETDPNTFEWSDGLIATATRRFAREGQGGDDSHSRSPSVTSSGGRGHTPPLSSRPSSVVSEQQGSEVGSAAFQQQAVKEGTIDSIPVDWKWIVLDGPVDTMWVENLNTVLDDSKILCLANGERVALSPGMRLLFEVDDLSQASPATISRCAMVYMDPVDLGWKPFMKTWLSRLPRDIPESGRRHLQGLFEHSVDRGLEFVRQNAKFQTIPAPEMSLVTCLCNLLSAFFDFMSKNGGFGTPDKETIRPTSPGSESSHSRSSSRTGSRADRRKKRGTKKQGRKDELKTISERSSRSHGAHLQSNKQYYLQRNPASLTVLLGKLYVFCFTWSFGGNFKRQDELDDDGGIGRRGGDRRDFVEVDIATEFDNFVHELFEVEPPLGVRLPASSRSIYSYFVDMDSGNFVVWDTLVPTTQSLIERGAMITIGETMGASADQQKSPQDSDVVTTVDTVRYSFLAGLLLIYKNPVLLTGESGVGKTGIVKHLLKRLGKDGGTGFKSNTILGSVFNFTDKNQALLDNISSLTRVGGDDDDGEDRSLDLVFGASRPKQVTAVVSSMLQFSAQTTADRTQLALTHKLIKKGRDTLGAPKGKKVVVFMDDLNMPAPEAYGAQPPLELLRQFMELGGFYDTKKLVWKDILDVTLIAACGPPGGGRNPVSPRLLKHFSILSLPQPSTRSLQHIYQVQLGRFLQDGEFMPEVKDTLFSQVSASIAIYYRMISSMRPTPAKIHYTFNIRDLSQVVTGLLQADESVIVNSDKCAQLFAHEATRVFHDRLVNGEDRTLFYEMLSDILHDYFKVKWSGEQLMTEPILFGDFVDVQPGATARIYKPVTDTAKLQAVLEEIYMRQNIGNTTAPQLVFFKNAVEHILRAARVFRQPGGHMLLVGLDGTGKSTTVQLATHIANCELYKLTLTRGYSLQEFRDDLKKVCIMSGVKGLNTVFLLTDSDIAKESFLEDINCILNSGEVPDLFDNEEMDAIAMDLKPAAAEAQIPDTRLAVYAFFIQRVKKFLHIVLAMSPAGNKFRQRCRMNPSLINCCTIDWYTEWDKEAMLSVAQVYFENADFMCEDGQDLQALKGKVAQVCVDIHGQVAKTTKQFWEEARRRFYVTPSSYMELIRIYSRMLKDQKTEFTNNRDRLIIGLMKLSEAESLVGTMQEELVTLGPRIEEKAKDTEVLLEQLKKDQEAVDQVREIVEAEETEMKNETQIVQDYADECQRDLASVIPALQSAIESLDSLDKADISEIRVYARPPVLVIMVMGAVCILLQEKPEWATAKQVLADAQFLKKLINFDKNAVPEKVFARLKKYSRHPDFTPEKVGAVSVACRSMCQWVLALEHYHEVYKMAKPKQKRVEEAKEALQLAQGRLAQKQASLAKIMDHLKLLQQQYQDSVNQRESLKERKKLTALRLQRASVLIKALSREKIRWADAVEDLNFKLRGLVGDTLVSGATVAYLGAFTAQYRKELIGGWVRECTEVEIPISDDYDFIRNIADANRVLRWQNEGLPQDTVSTENAIIMKKGRKWPLLIDPQGQASKWIREMEGVKLKVVQAADPNFMRALERAIRVGEPVLLQEVTESLDPSLKPILTQETFVRGGHQVMKIGDTEIEYNQNFRLYMTTSRGNPHFLPAVCIQVTLINFTVTFDGLQEQLLSSVVKQEKPQLEQERSMLLESIASDQQLLRDLEDKSLSLLQKTEGHILDDQDLVQTLQQSKKMSAEIHERVEQSEVTERSLNQARKRYLPVATRGAVLYFVLADLASVDVMYQFSLSWFQNMFISCIDTDQTRPLSTASSRLSGTLRPASARGQKVSSKSRPSEVMSQESEAELQAHMKEMIDRLTSNIYRIASVAMFAHHQLMFSFMLCSNIMRANSQRSKQESGDLGVIEDMEWTVFLQGDILANMLDDALLKDHDGLSPLQRLEYQNKGMEVVRPRWVTDAMWRQCQHLELTFPEKFGLLCRSIVNTSAQWEVFVNSDDPYKMLQEPFDAKKHFGDTKPKEAVVFPWQSLTSFQRLILIKILRLSTLTATVRQFVLEQMGGQFMSTGAIDLREMYEESNARTPLIFILSPGSDPLTQLLRFAKELRGSTLHLDMISLGRGQGPKAEELISKAQILKGRWIFLQNCHLAASWMPKLQTIVDNFNKPGSDVDPQFRLWLSSKPDPCFPISILQTGLKMTVEPPQGVQANLLRSFGGGGTGSITEALYEETCPEKRGSWRNLLFGLCFFNAVIHERKKYGRLGWNIPYEFNDSDLEVSVLQLQMLLTEQEEIPWPALWYLTGEVTFGGRVTDDWDRRCLHSLLQKFYHPKALQTGYYYSSDQVYHPLPAEFSHQQVKTYIEQLPTQDMPELFGMNNNAEKSCLEVQAKALTNTILSVQPRLARSLIGAGKSNDEIVLEMAADMLKRIPEQVDPEDDDPKPGQPARLSLADIVKIGTGVDPKVIKKKKTKSSTDEPNNKRDKPMIPTDDTVLDQIKSICQSALFTVLRQETDRFNNLLSIIHRSLKSLCLAVKGEVVMSEALEEAYNAMLNQRVPAEWKQASYESCKPLGPWIRNLILRVDFFYEWSELVVSGAEKALRAANNMQASGQQISQKMSQQQQQTGPTPQEDNSVEPAKVQPYSFWLPAFFFPQGFLTAVLQNHARKLGVSVDSLTFCFDVQCSSTDTEESLNDIKVKLNIKELGFKGSTPPADGVLVFGLYIDGASWNVGDNTLSDSLPGQRFCRLPEIHFIPHVPKPVNPKELIRSSSANLESPLAMFRATEAEEVVQRTIYECPLYRTSTRAGTLSSTGHSTNFVTSVQLPSNKPPEFWIMRGVALLCQLDD